MPFDSTAELLFNISANTDNAEENLEKFRSLNSEEVEQIRAMWESFVTGAIEQQGAFAGALTTATEAEHAQTAATEELAAAHSHAVSEIQATSGAIRLLEGSGGIRAMERFTATTLGLGPALQAIFPVVGALAFAEIISRMGEKVYELYKQWDPVIRAEERAKETAKALEGQIKSLGEEIRRLDTEIFTEVFGKIAGKMNESSSIIEGAMSRDRTMIAGLTAELERAYAEIAEGTKNAQVDLAAQGYGFGQISKSAAAAGVSVADIEKQLTAFQLDLAANERKASLLTAEAMVAQEEKTAKAAKAAAKSKEEFFGLSAILESLKEKVAAQGGEWARLMNEVQHYHFELGKAEEELGKLRKSGSITAQTMQRETAALARIPAMLSRVMAETREKIAAEENTALLERMNKQIEATERAEEIQKRAGESLEKIDREISDRLATADEQSWKQQRARLQQEIAAWRSGLEQKAEAATGEAKLTQGQYVQIAQIVSDGLVKIARTQQSAFGEELQRLQVKLDEELALNMRASDKLAAMYEKELQKYSAVEEAKAKRTADSDAERMQIENLYAQMRSQLASKYQNDLNALLNSEGWRGVFGSQFASQIKGNEQLMRQWATTTNQSLLLVKVAMQSLKDMGQQAFKQFADGMGQGIAQAIVYSTSIEKAMRQALASTLESIAGRCLANAIYAAGLGFLDLAEGDYPGAASAFTAAAIFGSVGAVSAIAGKYVAGPQGAAGASSGASGGSGTVAGTGNVSGAVAGGTAAPTGPNISIVVNGHVIGPSGASQLCDIINQAVYNNDATLYASHNPQGVPLG